MLLVLLPIFLIFAFFIDMMKIYRFMLGFTIILSPLIRIVRFFKPHFPYWDIIANGNMIFGESLFDYLAAIYLNNKGQLDQILICYSIRSSLKLFNLVIEERKEYLLIVNCFMIISCFISLILAMVQFTIVQKRERRRYKFIYNINYIFIINIGIISAFVERKIGQKKNIEYYLSQSIFAALLYYFKMSLSINFLILLSFYIRVISYYHLQSHSILNGISTILFNYSIFILSFRTKYISFFRYVSFYLIHNFLPLNYFNIKYDEMNFLIGNILNALFLFVFYLLEKLK